MSLAFVFAIARRTLVVVAGLAAIGGPAFAADSKRTPVGTTHMLTGPSGAELVGKMLAERADASDPDIPLPQRNLTPQEPRSVPLAGPRIFGRGEEGGAVVGLRIPIPADRGAFQPNTRSSGIR
jgi:hypothetical protein